jgi:hypothetical protein
MQPKHLYPILMLFLLIGCAHLPQSLEEKEKIYAPLEASLTHLNQKVGSHFYPTRTSRNQKGFLKTML